MDRKDMLRIGGLFEELKNVVCGASLGSGKEPVWDGDAIGKTRLKRLLDYGLVERSHGYYFPTAMGGAISKAFVDGEPKQLLLAIKYLKQQTDENAKL